MQEVDGVLMAAHELKAPLTVIRQLALSFDGASPHDEHIRAEILSVSERAIRQVNDLTKVRRLEDGLFTMEPVAVREVCDAVSRELKHLFGYEQRTLAVKYTNKERLATANRELLYSVIYNFTLNAMHYSDASTETILSVQDRHGQIKITVRDYGPMLPIKIWRKLKQNRLDQPTEIAMRPGSSGLGLFIASQFSRYMGAEVGAIRHHDGTSFYINLPVSRQASLFTL